jgi:glutamate synthase (NADPH/NADH) small chain
VGLSGDPVTIKTIEQEIADRAWAEGWITPQPPLSRTGRTVAVVGSGPAGLAAADQLNRMGHAVTVFERAGRVGGLLMYGIPNMKLDKDVVGRRVALMAEEGITFRTGVTVGADVGTDEILAAFDAVVLATGATVARDLAVPGRELGGIHLAMSFLRGNTRRLLDGGADAEAPIDASGRDVVVIGGGDTGTDCVGTAIRQGARSVRQLELLPKPPLARAADNPWPEWPKVYKLDYGQEEAAALWGEDPRRYSTTTRRFLGHNERVAGLEIADVGWQPGPDGRVAMREVPGTAQVIPADLVLLALGFSGPEQALPKAFDCELDQRGNVRAGPDRMTTVPGVFAAGDCVRGQSLVVWAIREGRAAAEGVDGFLSRAV